MQRGNDVGEGLGSASVKLGKHKREYQKLVHLSIYFLCIIRMGRQVEEDAGIYGAGRCGNSRWNVRSWRVLACSH
jgi:hypothetical protein